MKILIDFNTKVRKDIFEPTVRNESVHEIIIIIIISSSSSSSSSSSNEVRVVNFTMSKNVIMKSTMFTHHNIHKYT
jgi:hypothetical protein